MRPPQRLVALAALGLALAACGLQRGTAARPTLTSFRIQGTHALSEGELKSRLVTQESDHFFWHFFWRDARAFDEDAFANDRRRILRYYESQGYYGARIVASDVVPDGPGFVKVVVRVDEGRPTRVAELAIDGIDAAPEAKAHLRRLPLRVGDVFTERAYDETRDAILLALTTHGWAKAEVAQAAHVDPALAEVRVRYAVTPGERYTFGNVFVDGAAAVPRARIRGEAEQAITPGQTFDSDELAKAQQRVYEMGVFGGVRVSPSEPQPDRRIPVTVAVREAPFRTIRLGPGFTIQNTRWEFDATAGWTHRNWLGGLRKLSLDARAGYAFLPSPYNSTKRGAVGLATADFTQPAVIGRRVDFNLRAELERGLEPAYDFFAERLHLGLPVRYGRLVTFVPSVNVELYQLAASNQLQQADPTTGAVLLLRTCPGHDPNLCLLSYFEQRLTLDLRDDVLHTRRGLLVDISVQEGFSAFGNGSAYVRVLPEVRAFLPLPFGMVLAGRGRVGLVEIGAGSTDVPIVAKFTSGGPNLMRGYYTRQLSPVFFVHNDPKTCAKNRLDANGQCRDGTFLPVGGNGLIDGSLELRFPIAGSWSGVSFLDFGDVRLDPKQALNVVNLQYAAGVGVRYNTPFGPVRIDVAGRLPTAGAPDRWPGVQIVNLGTGGAVQSSGFTHHDPIVSVHLSIGEAF